MVFEWTKLLLFHNIAHIFFNNMKKKIIFAVTYQRIIIIESWH